MELLSSPKTEYLLEASLFTLHSESREWLNEIAFWNEEMSFFYKLIHMQEPRISFPTKELADLEKTLITITGEQLAKLQVDLESHERTLGVLIKNSSIGEEREYRDHHRRLLADMFRLQATIRKFKKIVFSFIK